MTFKKAKDTRHKGTSGREGERQGRGIKAQGSALKTQCLLNIALFLLVIYLADYEESLSEEKDLKSHR